jgi:putative heme-binding domain-containing protein
MLAPMMAREVRLQAARTAAVLQVAQLDATLAWIADRPDESPDLRLEALRGLILRQPNLSAQSARLIVAALRDEDRPVARLAAAEVLGRAQLTEEQLTNALGALRDNPVVSPSVVLPGLLRGVTAKTASDVIAYLEDAIRKGWRPSREELSLAVAKLDAFQANTSALAPLVEQMVQKQSQRLAEFEPLLQGGDSARGREVFFGNKVACATCHRIGNEGGTIGPDLTKLGAIRAGRDILESILVPSSTIAQGYDPYVIVTDQGKTLHGVIARGTADLVVLRDASGAELQLRTTQIQEMRRATTSLMPEGMERVLSREQFRDLLAFLQGLK